MFVQSPHTASPGVPGGGLSTTWSLEALKLVLPCETLVFVKFAEALVIAPAEMLCGPVTVHAPA